MKTSLPHNSTDLHYSPNESVDACPPAACEDGQPADESDGAASSPPLCNTGGEKLENAKITTFIDTFHFVWKDIVAFKKVFETKYRPGANLYESIENMNFDDFINKLVFMDKTSNEGMFYEDLLASSRLSLLEHFIKVPVSLVKLGKGLHGYTTRFNVIGLIPSVDGEIGAGDEVTIGTMCLGGNNDTVLLQVSGVGCPHIDFQKLKELCEYLALNKGSPRFTRIDIAADFHTGEVTIEDAVVAYKTEQFKTKVQPSHSTMGDWLAEGSPKGRTLYVGGRKNSKMARIYEKGKQLGDAVSKWVRVEIEFKNADAVLEFSMLTDTDAWFTGAYPWCATLVQSPISHKLKYTNIKTAHEIDHMVKHAKRCYGKVINMLLEDADGDLNSLRRLIGHGKPLKVTPHIGVIPPVADIMADIARSFDTHEPSLATASEINSSHPSVPHADLIAKFGIKPAELDQETEFLSDADYLIARRLKIKKEYLKNIH